MVPEIGGLGGKLNCCRGLLRNWVLEGRGCLDYRLAMARKAVRKKQAKKTKPSKKAFRPMAWVGFIALRATTILIVLITVTIVLFRFVNPPTTYTMWSEGQRLGSVKQDWVDFDEIAPVMARSVVAAEDANFCLHWGLDVNAIRAALEEGSRRGASTLSQQVAKNVFLWQNRSWIRKALETGLTLGIETMWSKQRILEVYLNVAEMDEGVFGVQAAAQHYFGVSADKLTAVQSARLAAVLPSPKSRSAAKPTAKLRKRSASILDGAATIRADGRAKCFED